MAGKVYNFQAVDATREQMLLRAAFCGPGGSGKTRTALAMATRMVEKLGLKGPIVVIDAESGSALRYAYSKKTGQGYKFKHIKLPEDDCSPAAYIAALEHAESEAVGASVIIIDSLSHAWNGIGGVLEQVDATTQSSRSKNQFSEGWKSWTPVQTRFIQRILSSSAHILLTLRSKVEWVIQENERGKKEPVKVGLQAVQREGVDYEPDLFFDMSAVTNELLVTKSRCEPLAQGERYVKPSNPFFDIIIDWMADAEPSENARSLGEAITMAVKERVAAHKAKDKAGYVASKKKLIDWCVARGILRPRIDEALTQFNARVVDIVGPTVKEDPAPVAPKASDAVHPDDAAPPGDAPPPQDPAGDADRLRAIDEGRA